MTDERDPSSGRARLDIGTDRRIVNANDAAAKLFGRPVDKLIGTLIDDVVGDGGMEVVSTVSHELRSPLTSIKGYTSLLLNRWDRVDDDGKRMMLQQVHHDADRVTRLVTELLDISRLQTGQLVLHRREVDLRGVVASVMEHIALLEPALDVTVDFVDGFPTVWADPDKVEQVLTNLIENAVKYASPVGLGVEGTVEHDQVALAVRDRGEGIAAVDLPRVFDRFFHREFGRPTGTGLGLWISRGLVEAHGGTLTVASTPGVGTTFTFTLPTGGAPGATTSAPLE